MVQANHILDSGMKKIQNGLEIPIIRDRSQRGSVLKAREDVNGELRITFHNEFREPMVMKNY
jgi:hypothetical protein